MQSHIGLWRYVCVVPPRGNNDWLKMINRHETSGASWTTYFKSAPHQKCYACSTNKILGWRGGKNWPPSLWSSG